MRAPTLVQEMVQVDGLNIVYESAGAGDPPVMFMHGIFGDRGYFAAQVTHLMRGHRVITFDLRSHGASGYTPDVTVEGFERDVVAVLEAAHAGPAVLCGHSTLGGVALSIAAHRPDLVRGVVMLDGVIFFPETARQGAVDGLLPALHGERWQAALGGYLRRLVDPAPPEVAERVMADAARARQETAISIFESLYGADFAAREQRYAEALASITCPLMYVRGKAPADLQKLQALKPDAMVGQVVGSGHFVMLSAADQVNAMLDRFLEVVAQRP